MQHRRFGRTKWQVSEIGMGGSWFYGRPEFGLKQLSHGVRMVERALELGINYFDTAPLYGNGRSEEVLGVALEGVTEPFYLATKVGYYPHPFDYTNDTIRRGFDASLKRLRRDRVDLLQVHDIERAGWEGIMGVDRSLETLIDIREQGLTEHIGLTGSDLHLMARVLHDTDQFASVLTFCKYDLLTQVAKDTLLPVATEENVAVIAASPLHGGLLGSTRQHWVDRARFQNLYGKLERVQLLLAEEPEGLTRTALRYLLSDRRVALLLCGPADLRELEACASVSDGDYLPEAQIRAIEEA